MFVSLPSEWRITSDHSSSRISERFEFNSTASKTEELRNAKLSWIDFSTDNAESLLETVANSSGRNFCPDTDRNGLLLGHIGQATLLIEDLQEEDVELAFPELSPGGHWKPSNCVALHKVGIVIPYRDRKSHLVRLLDFLIPVLKRQQLDFRFIVTEQNGDSLFNKGRIMNAAFRFGQRQLGLDCLIFHDVDMFPQDDRTPYGCPPEHTPRHVGAFVSNLGYLLWYNEIVGGVLAINVNDYEHVNGFSNQYWAWGGEDDDMGKRILSQNFSIERPNGEFIRFSMLKHPKRKRVAPNLVFKLLAKAENRMDRDGVNEENQWKILNVTVRPLYFHLLVDVGQPPDNWKN
ncbi:hypothetical protein niasHT_015735 [Heterodera trifolii]|uniref:Beta-1,4-N-acetylgalactosaminyltransferase n=1 Tax=Heterodera trifolii TaxID=157864 RepID=A0ABD2L4I6_9BILA